MQTTIKLGLFALLAVGLTFTTGCAGKKRQRQINALQAQVGVLTDELVNMDQSMRGFNTQSTVSPIGQAVIAPAITPRSSGTIISGGVGSGSTYRTPSGFELPSQSIQQALKSAGYYNGNLDGKIGSGTKSAVKSFQRDHGLTSDGVVGRQTWDKLKVYLSGSVK